MTGPSIDDQRRAAGLTGPMPPAEPDPEQESAEVVTEDATIGNEERLRGIPAVGRVSGTMTNRRPGDPVWRLEEEARDLNAAGREAVRDRMRAARKRLGKG